VGGGVVSFTPQPLYPREKNDGTHWHQAGWAPGPVWLLWRRE
jgi:hypothetical protein